MSYEVITRVIHDTSGLFSQGNITNRPCPAITIGVNSLNSSHYQVEYYKTDTPPMIKPKQIGKPAYAVPLMPEIEAVPWNGYNVISTFSGCGGSCLGYRMAGFKVLWASEFIPAAQEVYRLNHPDSILDTRDIRQVEPDEILAAIGLKQGELDVLDGSPPCASFSTAGKREKGWGEVKQYSDTKQRVDDLFFEYARIIQGVQPKVFVAENVSGLVKGKAKGYFLEILQALKDCGYQVKAKLLDAQWLGVPQMRQRIILMGVRNDLGLQPVYPKPLGYRYTVKDSFVDLGEFEVHYETDISRYAIGDEWDKLRPGEKSGKYFQLQLAHPNKPCPCVTLPTRSDFSPTAQSSSANVTHPTQKRKFAIAELKRICAFPDDFQLTGTYAQQWERLGRAVPPVMMAAVAQTIRDEILCRIP